MKTLNHLMDHLDAIPKGQESYYIVGALVGLIVVAVLWNR